MSGPQVALGYYQLQSETFSNGLLHTGDLGSIDAGGHVFIEGRKKDSPLLPNNVYVADATILPQSLGLPPMLTIMALAKRMAKTIME